MILSIVNLCKIKFTYLLQTKFKLYLLSVFRILAANSLFFPFNLLHSLVLSKDFSIYLLYASTARSFIAKSHRRKQLAKVAFSQLSHEDEWRRYHLFTFLNRSSSVANSDETAGQRKLQALFASTAQRASL